MKAWIKQLFFDSLFYGAILYLAINKGSESDLYVGFDNVMTFFCVLFGLLGLFMALNYKGIADKADPDNNFSKPGTVLYTWQQVMVLLGMIMFTYMGSFFLGACLFFWWLGAMMVKTEVQKEIKQ